jgi:3-hydroxyacyl-CoA dehydrogenase/enoyl-CoA hydratase/3-hydroxybutyryl-CoA epimerase
MAAVLYESAHVRVAADDGTATLWLDLPGTPPNRLSAGTADAIGRAVAAVRANPFVEVLVVRSAKPAGFSAGYDPEALLGLGSAGERAAAAAAGQRALQALAEAPVVSVAVVEGPCLGAGLELALACDYRLAVAAPGTELGFPEAGFGFLPGWGGLTRLTRRVGVRAALGLVLSGRPVGAREALDLGLVDHAFCGRRAGIEVRTFLDRLRRWPRKPRRRRWDWLGTGRTVRGARQVLAELGGGGPPAGAAAVRVAEAALRSEADGFAAERREFAAVLATPAARSGLRLLARAHRPAAVHPAPRNPVPPLPAVVGVVGADPAVDRVAEDVSVRGGRVVRAGDAPMEPGGRGAAARLTPLERDQAAARIRSAAAGEPWAGFDAAGLVLVAGGSDVAAVEAYTRPRAVIAVVGRPVGPAQAAAARPGRVAGLAFPVLPGESDLVEVVAGAGTSPDAVAALAGWVRELGGVPVVVSDHPRQVVRRVLAAAWDEAVRLAAEGVPAEAIDRAAVRAGFRVGPLEALDELGLEAAHPLVPRVGPLLAAGLRGRPAGDGFYHRPPDDRPRPNVFAQVVLWKAACRAHAGAGFVPHSESRPANWEDRLVYRAVNAAAAALGDEDHAGPAEIDLAVALGANLFRPRGGPLRLADAVGLPRVAGRLGELAAAFGRRFEPHPELARRAAVGERFHDDSPAPEPDRPRVAA